jgi:endonuclease-3
MKRETGQEHAKPAKKTARATNKPVRITRAKKTTSPSKTRTASDSEAQDRRRVAGMIEILTREFPDARCMLDHSSPFELLIATILAAQCTDAMVNQVAESLFKKYRTPEAYANAPQDELEKDIYKTGFFRNKAKSIKNCCGSLLEKHGGKVPSTMEELIALGGVGRKTANCVLGVSYGVPGIIVDTHVRRLSYRMGYTDETDPDKIEQDLMKIVPKNEWTHASHLLAAHGRAYCTAKKPNCDECPVAHLCPKILD